MNKTTKHDIKQEKTKTKRTMIFITVLFSILLLFGCGEKTGEPSTTGQDTMQQNETESNNTGQLWAEENGVELMEVDGVLLPVAPEGYVYDFQVGKELIPAEIAALGGEVQGTIHAFPSRIQEELMRLELEADPVKKAEADLYAAEIEAYLLETTGAECEATLIETSELLWTYRCWRAASEYEFTMLYSVSEALGTGIFADGYLGSLFGEHLAEGVREAAQELFTEPHVVRVLCQTSGMASLLSDRYVTNVYAAVFTDEAVNEEAEKARIEQLWQRDGLAFIRVYYYPCSYEGVIREKYENGNAVDVFLRNEDILLFHKEVKAFVMNGESVMLP